MHAVAASLFNGLAQSDVVNAMPYNSQKILPMNTQIDDGGRERAGL